MSTSPSDRPGVDPSAARELFVARLRAELHTGEQRTEEVSGTRRAYREAACLLSRFDPQRLRLPGEESASGGAVLELVDDCTTLGTQDQAGWSLKSDVRDRTLRELTGPEAARRGLECQLDELPAEPGPERFALACLSGRPRRRRG